jgi:hypothetical protein
MVFWVIVPFLIVVALISLARLRGGGRGPAVNWVPRRMRGAVNRQYRRSGWQEPYDASGNRRV